MIAAFYNVKAQEITLDKIYSGYYRGKGIAGIASLKDGENYETIEKGGIAKYSYTTVLATGFMRKNLDIQIFINGIKLATRLYL